MVHLQNNYLTISIAAKGAELQSVKDNTTQLEYMWNGDAAYWGKYSPVLFPIVGTLKDDIYYYKEHKYTLPRHGFAREMDFTVEQISYTEARFMLVANENTLRVYPFYFELHIIYTLQEKKLSCTYWVKNNGAEEMLFSIGAHPAFAVNDDYGDSYLEFNKDEQLIRYKLENGLIGEKTERITLQNNQLLLQHELFYSDAIVLKELQSNEIKLLNKKHAHGLTFQFNDFPYFGIWAAKDAPFVCLEPWCGIADGTLHNQQLPEKEGVNVLKPNEDFSRTWSISCY